MPDPADSRSPSWPLTTYEGWPDHFEGPNFLKLHWAPVSDGGRIECVGIELHTYNPDSERLRGLWDGPTEPDPAARTVTTELWRSVRLRQVIEGQRRELAKLLPEPWAEQWAPLPQGLALQRGDHQAVADVYLRAVAAGEKPRMAVAKAFTLSPSAAAKRIARAREHGLIPATTRGRAEGGKP